MKELTYRKGVRLEGTGLVLHVRHPLLVLGLQILISQRQLEQDADMIFVGLLLSCRKRESTHLATHDAYMWVDVLHINDIFLQQQGRCHVECRGVLVSVLGALLYNQATTEVSIS